MCFPPPPQESEIDRSKGTLMATLQSLRQTIAVRDKSQRDMQVLQSTIQQEVEDFEVDFKQKIDVRSCSLCGVCVLLPVCLRVSYVSCLCVHVSFLCVEARRKSQRKGRPC